MKNKNRILGLFSRYLLVLIIAVSVVLRIGAALYLGNQVEDLPGTADQISYHNLSIRVLGGFGFSFDKEWWPVTKAGEPTAHWSYLYTYFLVFIYSLFGVHPIAARIIQALIIGFLQPLLAYVVGKQSFGERIGKIAAGLTAIYVYFIYYSGCLMTESFYISGIMGIIAIAISIIKSKEARSAWGKYLLLGVIAGFTVLLRQLFLLVLPFIAFWILYINKDMGKLQTISKLAISFIIVGLMLFPFTASNYYRFSRFVLLNTNSGYAFFWGNHPIYGTNFVPILTKEMGTYQDLIPRELRSLDEAALDSELLKQGMEFVISDPVRYVQLSISRIPVYFQFWPTSDSGFISNISRTASFGLFLPFMVFGLIKAGIKGKYRKFSNPEWLFLLFIFVYSGIHLLSWALIRYRLPVDAVLILFAAIAVDDLLRLIFKWNESPKTNEDR